MRIAMVGALVVAALLPSVVSAQEADTTTFLGRLQQRRAAALRAVNAVAVDLRFVGESTAVEADSLALAGHFGDVVARAFAPGVRLVHWDAVKPGVVNPDSLASVVVSVWTVGEAEAVSYHVEAKCETLDDREFGSNAFLGHASRAKVRETIERAIGSLVEGCALDFYKARGGAPNWP